jgi:nucleoside 2-deoxyribosyltransferase
MQAGIEVTSRWIDEHKLETDHRILRLEAEHDLEDIRQAEWFILLNSQKRGEETTGKAVELGYALARGKRIVVVGERTNVFHSLPQIRIVETVDEAIREVLGG